ncbi:MAG: HAD-IA family hydrolase [Planctomycetota bacterium]
MLEPPLLFDLDGTLVDSLPDIAASVNHVRAANGLPRLDDGAVASMVGDGLNVLLRRALPGLGAEACADAAALYHDHHLEQCTRLVRPFPGVSSCLARWHADGTAMAVVTNKPLEFAGRILDALALRRYLSVVVAGDSTPTKKPHPGPCLHALDQLGARDASKRRGTMIGDSVQDLRAGKAAGLRTLAVLFGYRDEATLRAEGADAYWTSFGVFAA